MSLLTDVEKRIFLSAMRRERELCERYDSEIAGDIVLTDVCKRITRKVIAAPGNGGECECVKLHTWRYTGSCGVNLRYNEYACGECWGTVNGVVTVCTGGDIWKPQVEPVPYKYCPNCGRKWVSIRSADCDTD